MALLYELGIPLTLLEKRTKQTRFAQDIDIWGKADVGIKTQELFDEQSGFTKMMGQVMGDFYKTFLLEMLQKETEQFQKGKIQDKDMLGMYLDMVVFDATGFSKLKGVMKTSVRTVWPNIIVEKEQALNIQNFFAWKFSNSEEVDVQAFLERAKDLNPDNSPGKVFSDAIYTMNSTSGIRMPLNDRVSPAPMRAPENRPFRPFCVVRFFYEQAGVPDQPEVAVKKVEIIARPDDISGEDWLSLGTLRCELGTLTTISDTPSYAGNVPAAMRVRPATGPSTAAETRAPGQAKVRTPGGSPGDARPRAQNGNREAQEKADQITKVFEGSKEEFRRLLESKFTDGTYEDGEQGKLIFKKDNAKIEFNPHNRRVYFIAKAHQMRALIAATASFTQAPEAARSQAGTGTVRGSQRQGSQAGGYAASYAVSHASLAPSAPGNVYAPSITSRTGGVSAGSIVKDDSKKRVANQNFAAQTSAELSFEIGDHVTVLSDLENANDAHRWVYGINERTQEKGWFAHSYTSAVVGLN